MYAQADLRLCWSHIPHCWKSHVAAHISLHYQVLFYYKINFHICFDITKSIFRYHKMSLIFWITNSIFDITKSNYWYYKIKRILWYQNRFSCIKNMISKIFAQGRLILRHSTMLQRYQNLVLAICAPFMREVKALSRLHICTGSPEPRHSTIRLVPQPHVLAQIAIWVTHMRAATLASLSLCNNI